MKQNLHNYWSFFSALPGRRFSIMGSGLILCLLLLGQSLNAQIDSLPPPDSLVQKSFLSPVEIISFRYDSEYFSGSTVMEWEGEVLSRWEGNSIAQLLENETGTFIKSYGMGSIATASVQGTSAGHTQVTWMGAPVNSPGLGVSDLSLIPVALLGQARFSTGPSSLPWVSGGLGGVLSLDEPFKGFDSPEKVAHLRVSAGSFGQIGGEGATRLQFGKFRLQSRGFLQSAKNDFPFRDYSQPGMPVVRQQQAGLLSGGWQQDIHHRSSAGEFHGKLWFVGADRGIPPVIGTAGQGESQQDRQFRSALAYQNYFVSGRLRAIGYHFRDANLYRNDTAALNAENRTRTSMGRVEFDTRDLVYNAWNYLSLKGNLSYRFEEAFSGGWEGSRTRSVAAAYLGVTGKFMKVWDVSFSLRNELTDGRLNPLLPAVGIQYSREHPDITGSPQWQAGLNYAANYRIPTLNDLFWIPGGNPDLLPEQGRKGELFLQRTFSYPLPGQRKLSFTGRGMAFANHVQNWILWVPGNSGVWQAENIREVFARGADLTLRMDCQPINQEVLKGKLPDRLFYAMIANYAFTRSEDVPAGTDFWAGEGNQLIYVPIHKASLRLDLHFAHWGMFLKGSWQGKRFTLSDESDWLDPVWLADMGVSRVLNLSSHQMKIEISLNNLFNQEWQAIQNRPMPGRSLMMALSWDLNRKSK